jgi:hypothetical protein
MPCSRGLTVIENLESLASRFFSTVGIVEPAAYRTIEVLLDERAQTNFGGRERLLLAFSPETFHENSEAELVTFGSSFLDTMAEVATLNGNALHLYLNGLQPTTGRTLEKVRGQARIPGHLVEAGEEQLLMFHHALFHFKILLTGEEREEFFQDLMVDLHTGWTASQINEQSLRLFASGELILKREMSLHFSLVQAYRVAREKLSEEIAPRVKQYQEVLQTAYQVEQKQVTEHYQTLIARITAGKTHKGADPERQDAKIEATRADLELRLEDLEKRYGLGLEINLVQFALVSYQKAVVPLRLQQGKEIRPGIAIWDSLTRQGYISELSLSPDGR